MYTDIYSEEITKKLAKLKKKDQKQYEKVLKKIDQILDNPQHRYKELHFIMKGVKRVHIGHFVLVFKINHINKIISFEDYDHHDNIYL
ncbi:hypothetical protein AUJ83_02010 [Candidatus Woesearchaeota archaeon CG1_02_33_12]|nr:MAG: hypothetical protein AUJ83_02010 [Candidatus Woesearchaeota archaeon CG1_02_33_12]PIN77792.1 MAG: hypothetical protein COV14_05105 [Candidatus Woesearchaeota archaeon CG10_big_fil_rev_8_21_14_0_10_33_12]